LINLVNSLTEEGIKVILISEEVYMKKLMDQATAASQIIPIASKGLQNLKLNLGQDLNAVWLGTCSQRNLISSVGVH
jgi:hypothetical protein